MNLITLTLEVHPYNLCVSSAKLLGTDIYHNLKWDLNVKQTSTSCYRTLGI